MTPLRLALLLTLLVTQPLTLAATRVKLGTVVPDGSIWHRALKQMGAQWHRATQSRVKLVIFSGGIQGDQPTMIRRMRFDQLQGAALTVGGLSKIDEAFNVFTLPFFFNSNQEMSHVVEALGPTLRRRLEEKGFHLLHWGHGGWVQVFSKHPVRSLSELKRVKLFTSAGDDRIVQWYKSHGFKPVALALPDVMMGLQTGMIEGMPSTPLAALSFQWYRQIPYMLNVGLAPLVGATIMTRRAWNRISESDRNQLLKSAAQAEKYLASEVPRQDKKSVVEMQKRGLSVTKVEGSERTTWHKVAEKLAGTMRGWMVPEEIFDLAQHHRNEFRRQNSMEGSP